MRRGTTPTLTLTVDAEIADWACYVALRSGCKTVVVDGDRLTMEQSEGSTAHIDYSFDFSDVPAGATIQSVSVQVKGHCESTSSSSEVATLRLYSGSTAKGSESEFTSTSDQTVTMTAGTWTYSELQDAVLRFTIGYYGGAVSGAEWTVTYELDGYVYTISNVTADHALVFANASTTALYVKQGGAWTAVQQAYVKRSGAWQAVALDAAFDSTKHYVRG